MNKKAFEIQFNWLLVLIAGAAILLFFTAIVVKQKSISDTSTKATVLKSIEAIIIGAGVSTDTITKIDIPNSNIEVSCNKVSLGTISKQYSNLILFAPSLIKGDKLITQTLTFDIPYRATNFFYMTSQQVRYILIGNNELAKEINKSLPVDLKKEFYPAMPIIKNGNDYNVRFIIFGDSMIDFPVALEKMPDSDVSAIKVNGNNEQGTIEFYQKNVNSWLPKGTSYYLGKQSLIGAVYSDTFDNFECNMRNAFSRLELVSMIYGNRTLVLKDSVSNLQCQGYYSTALSRLRDMDDKSSELSKSSNIAKADIDKIADAAKSLADENKKLQIESCPLIY